MDPTSPGIRFSTASGQPINSESNFDISIPRLPSTFPTTGHVMPGFQENVVGVGLMCDADYPFMFTNHKVTIYSPNWTPIVTGWNEADTPRLWRIYLLPTKETYLSSHHPLMPTQPHFRLIVPMTLSVWKRWYRISMQLQVSLSAIHC